LLCQSLHISPTTFDAILAKISDNEVFVNNSNNAQMPLDKQLMITLFCFGHDGNASSLQAVANWAGVGKGTVVHLCLSISCMNQTRLTI
ncbi:hypothetical protein BJ912DRAFT_853885, partial [Pholiota molesta]